MRPRWLLSIIGIVVGIPLLSVSTCVYVQAKRQEAFDATRVGVTLPPTFI